MADVSNAAVSGGFGFNLATGKDLLKRSDLGLAIGIMAILIVLILPLPTWLLDVCLAFSLSFSILILMTAVFIKKPLEFSSFPAILLITTMMRLALNLASTRLILGHGSEGTDASGYVIQAFGTLIMQGNFVIGIIVFAILVIVNFVVITKGSGRIAEVAARFTLDAMPGKQMAIDADLSAGLIDEKEARRRRKELEEESNFFGAMDGASKFVRGDAIAGLMIVGINVIGGIIIAVAQKGMSFTDATQTFTLLTVGDGLVSQMPALIVSTAAGLMVSKAGIDGSTDKALMTQLSFYPQALGMAAAVMAVVGVLPGMPTIVFTLLSAGLGTTAWFAFKRKDAVRVEEQKLEDKAKAETAPKEEPIATALALDLLRVELGYGLLPLINDVQGHRITDQIKALRRQLATEMGFVMPSVRILDNMQLGANEYRISVKEVTAGSGELFPGQLLVMDPKGAPIELPGTHTTEPAFGLPATWVSQTLREEASFRGFTVVDPGTVLTTHLTEVLKSHMSELLSYAETKKLLDDLPAEQKKLVDELIPSQISATGVQRVLQTLLGERVSIRDLPAILEGIAEAVGHTKNALYITEHVRARLARQLCHANLAPGGYLPLVALSPSWEQAFAESIIGQGEDKQLAMAPSQLQQFIQNVRTRFDEAGQNGDVPVLLTSPQVRPFVRSIIERFRPQTVVMSQNEIHASVRLPHIGSGLMQLRTFTARDMREALVNVRSEMGDDAIIVASEKTKNGILVRAALDRPEEEPVATLEDTAGETTDENVAPLSFEANYRDGLIKRLRGAPQQSAQANTPFHRAELLNILRKHRLPDALAHDLAKTAEQSLLKDMTLALACALDRRMKSAPLDISKTAALLITGPHGVGKTALAAKIAAHARLAHRHVLFIATDADGAGALARLEAFADHLRLKVEVADSAPKLAEIVAQCARDNALAIIDTAGFDPRNVKARTAFQALATIDGVEALGVVSASGDAEETQEIIAALNLLGTQRIVVTGLDLPRRLGALTAAACSGQGLAQITRSPFVAAGLETLTPLALARTLMETATQNPDQGSTQ